METMNASIQPVRWYVMVKLADELDARVVHSYALGPLGSWSRAREVARKWERLHGSGTADTRERLPGQPIR